MTILHVLLDALGSAHRGRTLRPIAILLSHATLFFFNAAGGILGSGANFYRVAHTIIYVLECWEAKSILLEGEEP